MSVFYRGKHSEPSPFWTAAAISAMFFLAFMPPLFLWASGII